MVIDCIIIHSNIEIILRYAVQEEDMSLFTLFYMVMGCIIIYTRNYTLFYCPGEISGSLFTSFYMVVACIVRTVKGLT